MALSQIAWDRMVAAARAHARDVSVPKAISMAITDASSRFLDNAQFLELGFLLKQELTGPDPVLVRAQTRRPKMPVPDPESQDWAPVRRSAMPVLSRDEIWTRHEIRRVMSVRHARSCNYAGPKRRDPMTPLPDAPVTLIKAMALDLAAKVNGARL
jgi:hypothetical protein